MREGCDEGLLTKNDTRELSRAILFNIRILSEKGALLEFTEQMYYNLINRIETPLLFADNKGVTKSGVLLF